MKNDLKKPTVNAAAAQGHERSRRPSIPSRARSIDFAEPRRQPPPAVPRRDSRLETTPRHPFGPHSDTTLPNEPSLRTMWAGRPGCQDFIYPRQWRAGGAWATREPGKRSELGDDAPVAAAG